MSTPTVEEWWAGLPKLTKWYLVAILGTTAAVTLQLVQPLDLYLDHALVVKRFHVWRTLSCFTFFGPLGISLLFQLMILARYGEALEKGYFGQRSDHGTADFAFLLLFGAITLMLLAFIVPGLYFLGSPLVTMIIYNWSRTDPHGRVSVWGFSFQQWHLPFVLMAFGVLLGQSPLLELIGIIVGHLYHFLMDIAPRVYKVNLLKTPNFLIEAFSKQRAPSGRAFGSQGHRLTD